LGTFLEATLPVAFHDTTEYSIEKLTQNPEQLYFAIELNGTWQCLLLQELPKVFFRNHDNPAGLGSSYFLPCKLGSRLAKMCFNFFFSVVEQLFRQMLEKVTDEDPQPKLRNFLRIHHLRPFIDFRG
jgi:hypothetical protein